MKVSGFTNLMQVNNSNRKANNSQVNNRASYPNLAPLKKDTVSFCAKLNETDKSDELTPEVIKRIVTQSGDRRVDDAYIEALSLIVDKDKMPLLEKIASMKKNDGDSRFSMKNIVRLMSSVNKKNEPLFDELANLRYSNGSYRLHGADIANLLSIINEDNKPLFEKLIGMKDDKGRYLISGYAVARIFPEVKKYNIKRCEKLLRNGHPVCDELIYNLRHGGGSCWPF